MAAVANLSLAGMVLATEKPVLVLGHGIPYLIRPYSYVFSNTKQSSKCYEATNNKFWNLGFHLIRKETTNIYFKNGCQLAITHYQIR